jgi:hypothetical protein
MSKSRDYSRNRNRWDDDDYDTRHEANARRDQFKARRMKTAMRTRNIDAAFDDNDND